jgi:hypothetical protein
VELRTRRIVYPEGDSREIEHDLSVNQLVDLNGVPLPLPLPTSRMIVYRVYRKSTNIVRREEIVTYALELVPAAELRDHTRDTRGPRG